jgi:hypothetical protein
VQYVLLKNEPPVPMIAPDRPEEVTHVWLCSTFDTPTGLRWSPAGEWRYFDKGVTVG